MIVHNKLSLTVVAILSVAVLNGASIASDTDSEVEPNVGFESALRYYRAGQYQKVIDTLEPLLYPTIQFSSPDRVIEAQKLLGISHLFRKNEAAARKEFLAIYTQRPDYRFDPLTDPLVAVETFEAVKRENEEAMRQILAEEQQDRRAEELREADAERERQRLEVLSQTVVERTTEKHVYWLNFIPFGAGQFQNGHTTKGFVLLGTQLGLAALSLSTALTLRASYDTGQVPASEWETAQALQLTQIISGGLCLAAIAYGIIDALYFYEDETSTVQEYQRPLSWQISPNVVRSGGMLSIGKTF